MMKAELLSIFGDDDMVVDCARVSFSKHHSQYTPEQNARLITYLAKHKHVTPFFHPQAQFRITAPLFVARQWFRSTVGVARSEVSRRYVDDEPTFWEPTAWRMRPEGSVKQGSGAPVSELLRASADYDLREVHRLALSAYHRLLRFGIAPEQARTVLPQSMETQWVETGSLAYFARICAQRLDAHAQQEIQQLARQVADKLGPAFPISWTALMEYSV
jgi:thymidylate synthase (FAD)